MLTIDENGIITIQVEFQPEVIAMLRKFRDKEMVGVPMQKAINNILFDVLVERLGKTYRIKTLENFP